MLACSGNEPEGQVFGEGVSLEEAVSVSQLFASTDQYAQQPVRVKGEIADMCKHKGCWMQVRSGEQVLTVRFKDDAFSLPLDASGRAVDFEGILVMPAQQAGMGKHSGCADKHTEGEVCEAMRLSKQPGKLNMVATGLVLL
jgi:hypothetical protein